MAIKALKITCYHRFYKLQFFLPAAPGLWPIDVMPRIAFIDIAASYTGASPQMEALGGTQAAVCHLAAALVKNGAQVTLINQNRIAGNFADITSLPPEKLDDAQTLKPFDVLVINGRWTKKLVQTLRKKTSAKIIGWMHEAAFNDPWILPLPEFDGFVFVSNWQCKINASLVQAHCKVAVIPNGIAPAFHQLFDGASIMTAKAAPILVYAGSSKRGLFHLPQIFPALKQAMPELTFEVYSDCNIDNDVQAQDAFRSNLLGISGVTHVGTVSQAELPQRLKRARFFISPNTYPETFCICLAEAMAAGCAPIITARAALPETAHGFAALVPVPLADSVNYEKDALNINTFIQTTLNVIHAPPDETTLRQQIVHVNAQYNWDNHTLTWLQFLNSFGIVS